MKKHRILEGCVLGRGDGIYFRDSLVLWELGRLGMGFNQWFVGGVVAKRTANVRSGKALDFGRMCLGWDC